MEDHHEHIDGLLEKIKVYSRPVLFIGTDVSMYFEKIQEVLGDNALRAPFTMDLPRASELVALAELEELPELDAVHNFVPEYRRIAEAEANWLKEQKRENL